MAATPEAVLKQIYAHHIAILVRSLTKMKMLPWHIQVKVLFRRALMQVREEDVMEEWTRVLDKRVPRVHPTDSVHLLLPWYRWAIWMTPEWQKEVMVLVQNL